MISSRNSLAITARRLIVSTAILCTLLLGFPIDERAPQGAVGTLRAAAQTNMTREKTVTIPIAGMV